MEVLYSDSKTKDYMQNNNNLNCKIIYRLASVFLFVSSLFSILLSSETVSATTYSASISTSGSVSIDVGNVGNSTAVGTDNITGRDDRTRTKDTSPAKYTQFLN